MISIESALNHFRKQNQPIWSFNNKRYSYSDHSKFIRENSNILNRCMEKKHIALYVKNPLGLAQYIFALEGMAERILLLPYSIDQKLSNNLMEKASIKLIITDLDHLEIDFDCEVIHINDHPKTQVEYKNPKYKTWWLIPTSGTTGVPKIVSHTLGSLCRAVTINLEKGNHYIWGLLYDITRFAGLQVLFQSFFGGSTLILAETYKPLASQLEILSKQGCNALSATPTLWRKIIMSFEPSLLSFKRITLGGEITDKFILSVLSRLYPEAKIVHIYASTEAGVGFSVKDKRPGFPKSYLEKPVGTVELQVRKGGRLFIRPMESEKREFIGSDKKLFGTDGFINTGDLVVKDGDRYFFLGRENGCINVGGNKVQPEEIEQALLNYEGIMSAQIKTKNSPITGQSIIAEILVSKEIKDIALFKRELNRYCFATLEKFKVPSIVRIVEKINVSAAGKIQRGS